MDMRGLGAVALAAVLVLSSCEASIPEPTPILEPTASAATSATSEPDPASLEADLLFGSTQRCDLVLGEHTMIIEFPGSWATNELIAGGDPSCIHFGPVGAPGDWAIGFGSVGGPATFSTRGWVTREETIVAGRPAWRVEEWVPAPSSSGSPSKETLWLVYWVSLGTSRESGPTLIARTATEDAGDYMLNKAVLDRMMARLKIE
jgi:hypothetical protein